MDTQPELLAHHFAEAGLTERAVTYWLKAGERTLSAYAYEETLVHLQRALKAKEGRPNDADTAAILFCLGRAHAAIPHCNEAIVHLRSAFEAYSELGEIGGAVAVAEFPSTVARARERIGVYTRELNLVSPDSHQASRIQSNYGYALGVGSTDYQAAKQAFQRSISIARREKDILLEMRTLANAANAEGRNNRWQESLDSSLQAIILSESVDDLRSELLARIWAGYSLVQLGEPAEAHPHSKAMLTAAEKLRAGFWIVRAHGLEAMLLSLRGEWDDVRSITDRALAQLSNDAINLSRRALLEYELGNWSDGDSFAGQLLDHPSVPALAPVPLAMLSGISGTTDKLASAQAFAEAILASDNPPVENINAELTLGN